MGCVCLLPDAKRTQEPMIRVTAPMIAILRVSGTFLLYLLLLLTSSPDHKAHFTLSCQSLCRLFSSSSWDRSPFLSFRTTADGLQTSVRDRTIVLVSTQHYSLHDLTRTTPTLLDFQPNSEFGNYEL
ncbi:hypothetical protein STEG23_007405, partial [Scotinomys teguina]